MRFGDLLARENLTPAEREKIRLLGNALQRLIAFSANVNPDSGAVTNLQAGNVFLGPDGITVGDQLTINADGISLTDTNLTIDKNGISVNGTDLVIDDSGLTVNSTSGAARIRITSDDDEVGRLEFNDGSGQGALEYDHDGDRMRFYVNGAVRWGIESNGDLYPTGEGEKDIGNPDNYVGTVHYKTLTDQGCLGDYSDINALAALQAIKTAPDKFTPAGKPRLDYASFPDTCYKPAAVSNADVYENGDDGERVQRFVKGEKMGDDGIETTALLSIMLQAIRELAAKNAELEKKIKVLSDGQLRADL